MTAEPEPYTDSLEHLFDELSRIDAVLGVHLERWLTETEGLVSGASDFEAQMDGPVEGRGEGASSTGRMTGDKRLGFGADLNLNIDLDTDVDADEDRDVGADERRDVDTDVDGDRDAGLGARNAGSGASEDTDSQEHLDATRRHIDRRLAATEQEDIELRLVTLADVFDLDQDEVDAVLFALAPEVDRRYGQVYAYLQDDTRTQLSVGLLLRLWCADEREQARARQRLDETAPLRRGRLLDLVPVERTSSFLARVVEIDPRMAAYLLGSDDVDPLLAAVATIRDDPGGTTNSSDEEVVDSMDGLPTETRQTLEGVLNRGVPPAVVATGPNTADASRIATALSRLDDGPVVELEATHVAEDTLNETLTRTRREAVLRSGSVHVRGIDALSDDDRAAVLDRLDGVPGSVLLSGQTTWRPRTPPVNHPLVMVSVDIPEYATRKRLWERHLGSESAIDPAELAGGFRLSADEIADAVALAREFERETEPVTGEVGKTSDPAGPTDSEKSRESEAVADSVDARSRAERTALLRACRVVSRSDLGDLAQRVEPTYSWNHIVLPSDLETQLKEVASQITHRGTVYAEWGFDARFSQGSGVIALFSGPSGTGKTMAAEIIANDTGLDLFRIDLASIVSKYIGETEKNLARVFDAAETANAILLFDEADALWGKRSPVTDAHDRYANLEVAYLLQRVEAYDGPVILTSNLQKNIDEAFLRRIHQSVEFARPDAAARERIWTDIFPDETAVVDLDYPFLASFDVTGGNIKNTALTAAFLAAGEGSAVTMEHAVRAMRRELEKAGTLIDPAEFGDYREVLQG